MISCLYLIIFVREEFERPKNATGFSFRKYFVTPIVDFAKTISVKRPNHLRPLIWLQYLSYGCFWFGLTIDDITSILYLYLLTKFENFDETQFAQFQTYRSILDSFGLFLVIPLMSNYFKFNDISIQMIVCITESISLFLLPLAQTRWEFYLIQGIAMLGTCKWSLSRSILSKSVDSKELGKALSGIAIVAAAMPFATAPTMRGIYKATLDIFPAAFIILAGILTLFAFEINGILYLNKEHLSGQNELKDKDSSKRSTDDDFSSKWFEDILLYFH